MKKKINQQTNKKKNWNHGIRSHCYMQIDGGKVEILADFNFLCSKSTVTSDWSTKWKNPCSLEEKVWQT